MKALVTATVIVALRARRPARRRRRESRSATPAAPAPVEAEAAPRRLRAWRHQALARCACRLTSQPRHGRCAISLRCSGSRLRSSALARPATRRTSPAPTALFAEPCGSTGGLRGADRARRRRAHPPPLSRRAALGTPGDRRCTRHRRAPYGVLGDALIELGRYRRGVRDVRPHGDAEARRLFLCTCLVRARAARRRRRQRSTRWSSRSTPRAACRGRRLDCGGARQARTGRSAAAARCRAFYRLALAARPGLRARARRAGAIRGGARDGSARRSRCSARAVEAVPAAPATSRSSATSARRHGPEAEARAAVRRSIAAIEQLSGGERRRRIDLESRSIAPTTASASPRRSSSHAWPTSDRPSVAGDDVLAWALARNGRCGEALPLVAARRCGSARATRSFFFHRGMIERCLGRNAGARALVRAARSTLNPHFSLLWSPTARRYAA